MHVGMLGLGVSSINSHLACSDFKRIMYKNVFVLSTSAFLFSKLGIILVRVRNKQYLCFLILMTLLNRSVEADG